MQPQCLCAQREVLLLNQTRVYSHASASVRPCTRAQRCFEVNANLSMPTCSQQVCFRPPGFYVPFCFAHYKYLKNIVRILLRFADVETSMYPQKRMQKSAVETHK